MLSFEGLDFSFFFHSLFYLILDFYLVLSFWLILA
ncbi:hypothetical protein HPSNT_05705 [Helicobacter pylori SNT49]|uniref:Uncharacterized protein n=1 Tax=Helicobacter pylori SNT49 TaxID=1055530 RepID=G2MET4_HELPX|nr:hypothetical protein HPSNT_05705 [Helicobacter pylori SNT49]